ncbi:hypothetical protein COP2_010733 [Malus domestica]
MGVDFRYTRGCAAGSTLASLAIGSYCGARLGRIRLSYETAPGPMWKRVRTPVMVMGSDSIYLSLGIPTLLPFLKAVCQSKKSWQARHTGIKIVQQIAISIGCAVLPHLRSLVEIIGNGLSDENQVVRTITALSLSLLLLLLRLLPHTSPDEEMKKSVLKVVKQCVSTGVEPEYIRSGILPEFFKNFWIRRMALERRNYRQLDLKDESELYRRMVMETIEKVVVNSGASDIDARVDELLIDGILYAFQEQTSDDVKCDA